MMSFDDQSPQHLTSAELDEAIKRHREQTKKLLAEVRARRAGKPEPNPAHLPADIPEK